MALFTEWTTDTNYDENSSVRIIESPINPVSHDHSLVISGTTGSHSPSHAYGAISAKNPPYSKGFTWGRIRTLMRIGTVDNCCAGIYCLASQPSVTNIGSVYICGTNIYGKLYLQKNDTDGLTCRNSSVILSMEEIFEADKTYALELLWKVSWKQFHGIEFMIKKWNDKSFETLETVGHTIYHNDYMENHIPCAEGIYAGTFTHPTDFNVAFGHTQISKISPR